MRILLSMTFAIFFMMAAAVPAHAEYRVYRLGIKYHPEDPDEQEIQVLTTLDDLQYETYYKITPNQQTRLIHHWMCWGRTDDLKPYCPEPPIPDQSSGVRLPASVIK